MYRLFLSACFALLACMPSFAEDKGGSLSFGGDNFVSGRTATFTQSGTDDLFMAGGTVKANTNATGSVHMAGRRVEFEGTIARDAYLAGMDVELKGKVAGDATLAGNNVELGDVDGDVRVFAGTLIVSGTVTGNAILAGDEVEINGSISGDVLLRGRSLEFGEGAAISGKLIIYEDEDEKAEVPETVISADRIERRATSDWRESVPGAEGVSWWSLASNFLAGVAFVTILASLVAAFFPNALADLRRSLIDRPARNLWLGFIGESALVGSILIFAMTLIGLVLVPASLVAAFLVAVAGYVVAAYAFGVALMKGIGKPYPKTTGGRVFAAGVGALIAALIGLVPFLGWLFVLALSLAGVGALIQILFSPSFYQTA